MEDLEDLGDDPFSNTKKMKAKKDEPFGDKSSGYVHSKTEAFHSLQDTVQKIKQEKKDSKKYLTVTKNGQKVQ